MGKLSQDEIHALRAAIISAGLLDARKGLLAGIPASFVASLTTTTTPGEQVLLDLDGLNEAGELADGSVPLEAWLRNAAELATGRKEAAVFLETTRRLGAQPMHRRAEREPAEAVPQRPSATYNISIHGSNIGGLGVGDGARVSGSVVTRGASPDSILHEVWGLLEADLQDALSLAFNSVRRSGSSRISTSVFFAALQRLRPGPLAALLDQLPDGALPTPVPDDVPRDRSEGVTDAPVSSCIANSLGYLADLSGPHGHVSASDLFVDVARYGTNRSVRRLRDHGVGPAEIDAMAKKIGLTVVGRGRPAS